MAAAAAQAASEAEAEALVGAASVAVLSPADRRAIRRVLYHLIRGSAVLTRILYRRRITRAAIPVIPTVVGRTARVLATQQAAGRPVTRARAARVMARQTRRTIGRPRTLQRTVRRNQRVARAAARRRLGPPRAAALRPGLPPRPPIVRPGLRRPGAVGVGRPRGPMRAAPMRLPVRGRM